MATVGSSKRHLIVTSDTYESNGNVVVGGDLTINGTTTTIDTANLLVEDKNIIIGNVSSPTDTTADGGGITLKGASDYTINWSNANNRWEFNQGIHSTGSITGSNLSGTNTGDQDLPTDFVSAANGGTFSGDVEAPGIYVGATNTSFDFYNNGTSYLNGATTVDAAFTQSGGGASSFSGNVSITGNISAANLSGTNTGDQDLSGYALTGHNHNIWDLTATRSGINIDTVGNNNFWDYLHGTSTDDGTHVSSYQYVVSFGDESQGIQFSHTHGSGSNDLYFRAGSDNPSSENGANTYKNWRRVLTTSDEGSGNGLDADTLDSLQASSFLRSDANDTFTGTITGNMLYLGGSQITASSAKLQVNGFQRTGTIYLHEGTSAGAANYALETVGSELRWNTNKVWHAGNDGPSSGLDADTLDGQEASAFALTGHNHDGDYIQDGGTTAIGNINTIGTESIKHRWHNTTVGRPAEPQTNEYGTVTTLTYDTSRATQLAWDIDQGNLYGRTLDIANNSGTWKRFALATEIPTDFVSAANGGTFSGNISASNLSGTNTGDQDLSGYALTGHNHTSLTGVTNISFNAQSSDSASISTTINSTATYFDFNLTDDNNNDWWRWRFTPSGSTVYDAMTLKPASNGNANLTVSGNISADNLSGTNTGDQNLSGYLRSDANDTATGYITFSNSDGIVLDGDGSTPDSTTATYNQGLTIEGGNMRLNIDVSNVGNGGAYIQTRHESTTYPNAYYTLALNPLGGNVGIGTASPSHKLQVVGNGAFNSTLDVQDPDVSSYGLLRLSHDSTGSSLYSNPASSNVSDVVLRLGINNSEKMRIANNGNVGIGETNPGAKLDVDGVVKVNGGTYAASADTVTDAGIVIAENDFIYTKDGGNLRQLIGKTGDVIRIGQAGTSLIDGISFLSGVNPLYKWYDNNSVIMTLDSTGLGISDTSPSHRLSVSGNVKFRYDTSAGGEGVLFQNNTSGGAIQLGFQQNDSDGLHHRAYIVADKDSAGSVGGKLSFRTRAVGGGTTEAMTLRSDGDVGIGTTSPAAKLDVTGGSIQLSTSGNGVYFGPSSAAQIIGVSGASSYLSFGTIGTERVRITSSGNVGIGTTSPNAKLDINDSSNDVSLTSTANYAINTGGAINARHYKNVNLETPQMEWSIGGSTDLNWKKLATIVINDANYSGFGAEVEITDFAGNYGSSMAEYGDVYKGGLSIYHRAGTGVEPKEGIITIHSDMLPYIRIYKIAGSGNSSYQIQVKSPANYRQIHVKLKGGNGNQVASITPHANDTNGSTTGGTAYTPDAYTSGNQFKAAFPTVSANKGIILDKLSVNLTSPAGKFDVRTDSSFGNCRIIIPETTNQNPVLAFYRPTGSAENVYPWHLEANGSTFQIKTGTSANIGSESVSAKVTINSSGNVGIGQTNPSAYKLDVTGTIRATGDVIAYSDIRVKENIKTINNALDKVKALRGVEYNKIDNPEKSIGVIAQEIEEVIPEVVREDDLGMKSVAYGNITAVLIEAIKEQQKQIDELKSIINGSSK